MSFVGVWGPYAPTMFLIFDFLIFYIFFNFFIIFFNVALNLKNNKIIIK